MPRRDVRGDLNPHLRWGVTTPGPVRPSLLASEENASRRTPSTSEAPATATDLGVSSLELRQYLDILRRHKWFILAVIVVVGLAAGITSNLRTPLYQATARVLLTPNNPTEQLNPANAGGVTNPNRYVTGQRSIAESENVARLAASSLADVTLAEIEGAVSVKQGSESDVLDVSATSPDPVRARDIANAVAKGYIENRRLAAVAGLEQAAKDLADRLGPLQSAIGSPDTPGAQAAAVQYETLYSRQQELLVDITLKRGEAELIAEANVPGFPVSPHPKRDAALGLSLGLVLGVAISVARDHFNDRIRSVGDVEKITGMPMLAQLPYDEDAARSPNALVVADRPQGALSEAMRSLRTALAFLGVDAPLKTIVVTSAAPGEGKSLVAANLAAAFAQSGFRTVLVSGDLRRSRIEALFGAAEETGGLTGMLAPHSLNGASSTLNGAAVLPPGDPARNGTNALVATGIENLRLLPCGASPPNPAELLGSRRMVTVLASLAAQSDIVVIDTPPLLAVTDAAVLASKVDGVVLVTAINETRRDGLARARAVLDATGARVLGTVVNKMTKSQGYLDYDSKYYGAYSAEPKSRGRKARAAAKAAPKVARGMAIATPRTEGENTSSTSEPTAEAAATTST